MANKFDLATADYIIFGIMLAVSAAIGLYFRIFGSKQKTNEDYLLAGKDMSILPVSFSLMASFMSGSTFIGIPAEMYMFGTHMAFMNIGFLLGTIISSFVFLPVYFNTGVLTSYEYLEKRLGKTTRRILSGIFLIQNVLFCGVSLYAPALALSAVTNLSIWTSVISIGVVCTFYCTLGGMKAVLWTDVFQSLLMYTCLFAIVIKGCIDLGGMQNIFQTAYDGGRILLPTFHMDFSARYTIWSVFLQGLIITTQAYGVCQVQVQRELAVKTLKRSVVASLLSAPMLVVFHLLCCLCGLIFYVYFKSCDPVISPNDPIHSADQLMPYYITSTMTQYPGLPGLCIAGIFSASLSTVSSLVNSMAAVTYEDIIHPIWPQFSRPVFITKSASIFYGVLTIAMSFLVASLGNLIKASILVIGMVSGPSLGVYILAALTTTANEMGTNIGVVAGCLLAGCMTFVTNSKYYPQLPVGRNCSEPLEEMFNSTTSDIPTYISMNSTDSLTTTTTAETHLSSDFEVSFMWISSLSLLVSVVVGYFASFIASYCRGDFQIPPPELISPVRQWFSKKSQ